MNAQKLAISALAEMGFLPLRYFSETAKKKKKKKKTHNNTQNKNKKQISPPPTGKGVAQKPI
jgi:hypothetical protein